MIWHVAPESTSHWNFGSLEKWAPRYLVRPLSLTPTKVLSEVGRVKIIMVTASAASPSSSPSGSSPASSSSASSASASASVTSRNLPFALPLALPLGFPGFALGFAPGFPPDGFPWFTLFFGFLSGYFCQQSAASCPDLPQCLHFLGCGQSLAKWPGFPQL